ncbi:related to RNA helicase [Melanopsichium pennsylvanicum]|uniref:RNA helicase n=2 Tax=Melanopsichium pennsylvanicum TaxID=63383 RepID=A0AAJ5C3G3_9BASI|nr:related to RNA helicase [Melanopsichium pennsylvanicum 4]SNX82562.1 related to RNA helicase [Melanopsichium pennsylvanicum]
MSGYTDRDEYRRSNPSHHRSRTSKHDSSSSYRSHAHEPTRRRSRSPSSYHHSSSRSHHDPSSESYMNQTHQDRRYAYGRERLPDRYPHDSRDSRNGAASSYNDPYPHETAPSSARRRWDQAAPAGATPPPPIPCPSTVGSAHNMPPHRSPAAPPGAAPGPPPAPAPAPAPAPSASVSASASARAPGSPSSAPLTAEEQAKLAKKARLEAWRKEQAAKKALEEARLRAQSIASAVAPASHKFESSTPASKHAAPTSINATGLRMLSIKTDPSKINANNRPRSMMEDASEPMTKPRMNRFDDLPPLDPKLHSPAKASFADDDDDDQDTPQPGSPSRLDVSNADMEVDEEPDPLDAFMSTVKTQVAQVDADDRRKAGVSGDTSSDKSKMKAFILGQDDSDVEIQDNEQESDELDKVVATEDLLALAAKKIKKKELATVDHDSIDYEHFRKVFYHPPTEIQDMSEELANQIRLEMDAITVRGKDCPKPLTKWSHCGLPASCLDVIKRLAYAAPTPIQSQAIPAIMSGRDIIGVAKTGSGKTMAFLLPMFRHIKDQRPVEASEGPVGIIMTPTRELAVQIYREMRPFIRALDLRAACVYGGAPISEQIAEMKKTADVVVATPGRLIDLLTANSGRVTNLRRVTYLVLDEADRMFDMGFEPQVMKIVNNIRPDRQTVLFSATFPKQMESLARKVLKNKPVEITVGGRSVVAAEIEQIVEVRPENSKFHRLLEILGELYNREKDARTLIFVDRQEAADDLLKDLIRKGYVTMSLHGGKDQVDRDETIFDFKAGNVPIVTATSVAARGLDVKQLKLVINYDVPNHMEDYVHRAGRTGRAGQKGTCITFITPEQDRYARDIIAALKASSAHVPPELETMAEAFKEKLAAGKAKAAGSGFGGKGLDRLETDREKALKAQKSAYGEADEDGKTANAEGEVSGKPGAQTGASSSEDQLSKIQGMKIEIMHGAAPESVRDNKTVSANDEASAAAAKTKADQEQEAKEAAQLKAQEAALEAAKAHGADTTKLAAVLANIRKQANARKEAARNPEADKLKERKARDPDATDYHAIVPINDFPQRARWRVTNKETMSHLIESTGASITNKGVFYKEGTEPQPGEPPKLQLLIESNNKSMVEDAVREIQRLLVEATQAVLEAEARNPGTTGRYTVV